MEKSPEALLTRMGALGYVDYETNKKVFCTRFGGIITDNADDLDIPLGIQLYPEQYQRSYKSRPGATDNVNIMDIALMVAGSTHYILG